MVSKISIRADEWMVLVTYLRGEVSVTWAIK